MSNNSNSHTHTVPGAVGASTITVGTGGGTGSTLYRNITTTYGAGGGGAYFITGSTGPTYSDYTQNDIVLRRPGKPDLKVGESLDLIMKRLIILTPDLQKLEKYAALKKAYDNYKLIESLIQEENKDGK